MKRREFPPPRDRPARRLAPTRPILKARGLAETFLAQHDVRTGAAKQSGRPDRTASSFGFVPKMRVYGVGTVAARPRSMLQHCCDAPLDVRSTCAVAARSE